MNVVETCKCGGSVRVVGSPVQTALQVASFRDAHKVCREPKFEVATVPASTPQPFVIDHEGLVRMWREVAASNDDLPCCPSCGHTAVGTQQCNAYFGDGPEACPCTNIWHREGKP